MTSASKGVQTAVVIALDEYFAAGDLWPEDMAGKVFAYGADERCIELPTADASWRFQNLTEEDYMKMFTLLKSGDITVSDDTEGPRMWKSRLISKTDTFILSLKYPILFRRFLHEALQKGTVFALIFLLFQTACSAQEQPASTAGAPQRAAEQDSINSAEASASVSSLEVSKSSPAINSTVDSYPVYSAPFTPSISLTKRSFRTMLLCIPAFITRPMVL